MTYALSGNEIIHEYLDDEVIVANLDVGIYYSIRGSGVIIWQLLLSGHTINYIADLFTEKYGIEDSFSDFLQQLVDENLLTYKENSSPQTISITWPKNFSVPIFEKYDEMKNLLMLDPIHEVDEQGWPHKK